MTRRHRKILRRASRLGRFFYAEGKDARPAWELLNAKLIEGETQEDKDGVPLMVVVMGITLAGRDELSKPFSRLTDWLVHALDITLGAGLAALFNWLLK